MSTNKKALRLTALGTAVLIAVPMLASCAGGSKYEDKMGDLSSVSVIQKQEQQVVEYTGEPHITYRDVYVEDDGSGNNSNNNNSSNNNSNNNNSDNNNNNSDNNNNGDNNDNNNNNNQESPNPDTSGTPVTMMTQNLRVVGGDWDYVQAADGAQNTVHIRTYRFQELVNRYDPDVIALQECGESWITQGLPIVMGSTYAMEYKYRADSSKESTPVLYKKDKYDRVDGGFFWLSDTPDVSSPSWDEKDQNGIPGRICSWVKLRDKATGVTFNFYSTHFGLTSLSQKNSGLQFAQLFSQLAKGTYAFVLGDFNLKYRGEEYNAFMDDVRITDLREVAESMTSDGLATMGDMRNGSFSGYSPEYANGGGSYIDHILAKPNSRMAVDFYGVLYDQIGVEGKEISVPTGYVSDHFAVLCKVRLNTSQSYADYYASGA